MDINTYIDNIIVTLAKNCCEDESVCKSRVTQLAHMYMSTMWALESVNSDLVAMFLTITAAISAMDELRDEFGTESPLTWATPATNSVYY